MPSGVAVTEAFVPSWMPNSFRNQRGMTSWPLAEKETVSDLVA
jgi:hypothetical protein